MMVWNKTQVNYKITKSNYIHNIFHTQRNQSLASLAIAVLCRTAFRRTLPHIVCRTCVITPRCTVCADGPRIIIRFCSIPPPFRPEQGQPNSERDNASGTFALRQYNLCPRRVCMCHRKTLTAATPRPPRRPGNGCLIVVLRLNFTIRGVEAELKRLPGHT